MIYRKPQRASCFSWNRTRFFPCILAALAAANALAQPGRAGLVTINFDDQPASWVAPDYSRFGVLLYSADTLPTRQVGGRLEIFDGACQTVASGLATSPPNILMPQYLDGINQSGAYSALGGDFVLGTYGPHLATDYVSFWVISPPIDTGWEVQFFGADGDVVNTVKGTAAGNTLVSLYRDLGISGFVLYSPAHQEGIDDLAFDAPVVPSPGTLLLALVAGLMFAGFWQVQRLSQL